MSSDNAIDVADKEDQLRRLVTAAMMVVAHHPDTPDDEIKSNITRLYLQAAGASEENVNADDLLWALQQARNTLTKGALPNELYVRAFSAINGTADDDKNNA